MPKARKTKLNSDAPSSELPSAQSPFDDSNLDDIELNPSEVGSIPRSGFAALLKKHISGKGSDASKKDGNVGEDGSDEGSDEKSVSKKKRISSAKCFADPVEDMADYNNLLKVMEERYIPRLTNVTPVKLLSHYGYADSTLGIPIPYYIFSIPTVFVGYKRAKRKTPSTDDFFGAFISEMSMFHFLIDELGLPRDHVIIKHTCEYYKIPERSFNEQYSDEKISAFGDSIRKSRFFKNGHASLPFPNQLGRDLKTIKNCWYYNKPGVAIPEGLLSIDTDVVLHDLDLPSDGTVRFYTYQDFKLADDTTRHMKKVVQENTKDWDKIIKKYGVEQAMEIYNARFPKVEPTRRRKRNSHGNSNSSGDDDGSARNGSASEDGSAGNSPNLSSKVEKHAGLSEVMKKIESKILIRSSEDFYSNDLTSSSDSNGSSSGPDNLETEEKGDFYLEEEILLSSTLDAPNGKRTQSTTAGDDDEILFSDEDNDPPHSGGSRNSTDSRSSPAPVRTSAPVPVSSSPNTARRSDQLVNPHTITPSNTGRAARLATQSSQRRRR